MPSAENIDTDIWFVFRRRMLVSRRCILRPLASACGRLAWGFWGWRDGAVGFISTGFFCLSNGVSQGGAPPYMASLYPDSRKTLTDHRNRPTLILGWPSLSQKTFANPSSSLRLFKCICGPSSIFETCYAYLKEQLVLSLGMHKLHTLSMSASLLSSPATFYHGGRS
ncbi:hypothetical protein BJX68DRAFT_108515 [Aspergillus pseudodeflectus]|uniref:Uncharacterized protein n=1 Tax=Aspergillus pseudodeflectus TaxID=176178 RepID=A0ABR4K5N0_9EURO